MAEFLAAVDAALQERPATKLDEAVAGALPHLGFFRCRDLIGQLNSTRGDKLLRQVRNAARIGSEVLDDRTRETYLQRLASAALDADEALGGMSAKRKRELLERFIDGQLRDSHHELLELLQIDWREVQKVITAKSRVTQQEKFARSANRLTQALGTAEPDDDDVREVLANLPAGEEPDAGTVDRLLATHGAMLTRSLRNDVRRLVKTRTRQHADFLVGLAALAVEMVQPQRGDLSAAARLRVTPRRNAVSALKHLPNALEGFRVLYGGLDQIMPSVTWEFESLWSKATARSDDQPEDAEDAERERVVRLDLPFRVTLLGSTMLTFFPAHLYILPHNVWDCWGTPTVSHLESRP